MSLLFIQIVATLLKIAFLIGFILLIVPILVLAERKVAAWIQDRIGPNRVGPRGLMQPMADGVKFIAKEDLVPRHVDRKLYIAAPALILIPALMVGAIIPFSKPIPPESFFGRLLSASEWATDGIPFQIAPVNVGLLVFFAIASLGVYGVILAGWASNNKYTLLGGLRASAQMVSYELSLGLAVLSLLVMVGTLRVDEIVELQRGGGWFFFYQPIGWFIFTVAAFAETNRAPFDLAEAEQELVGGYHTEYSGMKFAMFFLAEYANMTLSTALNISLFLGGYTLFGLDSGLPWWGTLLIFIAKIVLFLFIFLWVRWTLPRFRYDQLMRLGWKMLLPLAMANLVVTTLAVLAHEMWRVPLWPAVFVGQVALVGGAILASVVLAKSARPRTA